MTIIMIIIATSTQTPILMWLAAMGCDTLLLMTFMVLKAWGKL